MTLLNSLQYSCVNIFNTDGSKLPWIPTLQWSYIHCLNVFQTISLINSKHIRYNFHSNILVVANDSVSPLAYFIPEPQIQGASNLSYYTFSFTTECSSISEVFISRY